MENTYWHRQDPQTPLFGDLLWGRPENKLYAGKLLIAGGNAHGFAVPSMAYQASLEAGIGVSRVLLPDALQKTVGKFFVDADFVPSTPSGSFARSSLASLLDSAQWADAALWAGELGRNSETAIVIESFLTSTNIPTVLTRDAVDYFTTLPLPMLTRPKTVVVLTMAQLQRICMSLGFVTPITFKMSLIQLVDALHELTSNYPSSIVLKYHDQLIIAHAGQVSTTPVPEEFNAWRTKTASYCAVWWIQNPSKIFEALTVAAHQVRAIL